MRERHRQQTVTQWQVADRTAPTYHWACVNATYTGRLERPAVMTTCRRGIECSEFRSGLEPLPGWCVAPEVDRPSHQDPEQRDHMDDGQDGLSLHRYCSWGESVTALDSLFEATRVAGQGDLHRCQDGPQSESNLGQALLFRQEEIALSSLPQLVSDLFLAPYWNVAAPATIK